VRSHSTQKQHWRVALAVVVAAAVAGITGCAPAALNTSGSSESSTVRWGWALPTSWDSAAAVGYDVHVLSLVYSGLTKLSATGEAEPDLAAGWDYNETGDQVTFHLRDGQTFSDGAVVDAAAVKKSLERAAGVEGSTAAQSLAAIEAITVDSELDVTLDLAETNYQIPLLLAGLVGHILSPDAIDSGENIALNPVGSGPFVLTDYVPDSQATLERNPDYWNAEEITFDVLEVLPKPDAAVAVAGVQSGQYTIAHIDNSQIEAAEAAGLRVDINDIYNVYTLQVNTRFDPFTDDLVTQALSHTIDRRALVDGLLFGEGTPAWQPFNDENVAFSEDVAELYPHDITKAKKLLADAGFPDGVDVTLYTYNDPIMQKVAEVIQTQAAEAGFNLTLEVSPAGGGILQNHEYTLSISSFSGRESPVQALEVLYGAAGWMNISEQESPNLAPALDVVRRTPLDSPDYPAAVRAATTIAVAEKASHIFLVNWVRPFAINPGVTGFDPYVHTQRFEGVEFTQG
jgi:peptide/nickel transport system substrate-binding protein